MIAYQSEPLSHPQSASHASSKLVCPVRKDALARPEAAHFSHTFHGSRAFNPERSKECLIAQRVHGLPEAVVLVGRKLLLLGQGCERIALPNTTKSVTFDDSTKKPPVIIPSPRGFFLKVATR